MSLVNDLKEGRDLALDPTYTEAMRLVIGNPDLDKAFIGEMLALPSEGVLGQQYTPVDVDGIHWARKTVVGELAKSLETELLAIYHACQTNEPYEYTPEAVGKRRLKNMVLGYLMELSTDEARSLCLEQFKGASNMTDEIAAFTFIVDSGMDERSSVIEDFYQKWHGDELVLDKWFSAQALSSRKDVLDTMDALNEHPDFDLKTPNRVRSLISAFCSLNQVSFHHISGRGYEFLGRNIKALDPINPQIAAGLSKQLTPW